MTGRPWRAPLCRRDDEHPEVEHNWDSLAKLGKECSCVCHFDDLDRFIAEQPPEFHAALARLQASASDEERT